MSYLKHLLPVLIIAFTFVSCAQDKGYKNVSVTDLKAKVGDASVTILDVRTPDETNQGIVQGAEIINFYDDSFDNAVGKLDKKKPIYVYCAAGGRSAKAADKMTKMGFEKVYNVEGGYGAWQNAGFDK